MHLFCRIRVVGLAVLTAAAAASAEPAGVARIVFGSCLQQGQPQPVWEGILAARPDLFIFAGDNVYADTEDMDRMRAVYAQLGREPGYRAVRAACPVLATWDDHDYGVNDGGAEYPAKEGSKACFLEFFGIPADHPVRDRPGIYRAETRELAGHTVQVLLLDTRTFRGPLVRPGRRYPDGGPYAPDPDPAVPLLGEAQWAWLEARLREPADLRLLVSSIQLVAEDHHWETWANLPAERERLFALVRRTEAAGVIVLSGDRHHGELSVLEEGIGYPLHDLTASGLNRGFKRPKQEANRHRVGDLYLDDHFGLVELDAAGPELVVRLQLRDAAGGVVLAHEVPLARLRPGAAVRR